jgi:aspartyl-tRNA(Asn)/glutamyl-tRNA(Gln) amidotransferase subunit C
MITVHDIENLANLARIKVDENEKTQLVKEIEAILVYVDQIKKAPIADVDVDDMDVDAKSRVGAVKNVMRPDEPRALSVHDRERILAEVPDREGDFVAVKKIL